MLNKKNGQPIFNEPVDFVVTAGGGTVFVPTVATDNSSGIALDLWTLGTRVGFDTLQARVVDTSRVGPLAGATSIVTFAIQATPLAAAVIGPQAANGQTAVAGSALPISPAVLVTDRFGNPIGGVSVTFAVSSGGGSVAGPLQTTTASGIATVGGWTLGTTAGPNTLTATAAGLTGSPVTFTATGINASAMQLIPATSTVFTGTGVAGSIPAAMGPAVRVVDANNNGVPNVAVTFTVTGPICPSCTPYQGTSPSAPGKIAGLGSVTTLTDATGRASGGDWTLATLAGANTLQATAVGLTGSPVVFTATGTAGAAALLFKKAGDGQTGSVGTALATQPAVSVTDVYGNPSSSGTAVTFTVQSGGGGVPTAPSAIVTTDLTGSASVSWMLGPQAGANTLTAAAVSHTVTFTATGSGPGGLNITNYRGDAQTQQAGTTLLIAPAVQIADQSGHSVAGVQVVFNVTSGGGTTTGATQVTDVNGIATVGAWTIGPTSGVNELKAAFNTGVSRGSTIFVATGTGNFWKTQTSMPTGTSGAGFGVIGGKLYAAGGQVANNCAPVRTLEVYDPAANSWTSGSPMPTARWYSSAGVVNGILYVVGGEGGGCPGPTFRTVEAYDPVANSWATKAPMPTARYGLAVGVVNGILFAVGGAAHSPGFNTVEAYDPVTNTWTARSAMPTARVYPTVAVVNGILYAVGGIDNSGNYVTTVEAYDPVTNTWTTRAPMATARGGSVSGVVQGMIYMAGGNNATGFLATLEGYDPTSNAWTTQIAMPTARANSMGGVLNNAIYVVGGQIAGPVFLSTNEAYQP